MGVTSSCSQPGLPAWHIGSGMLQNWASNDSCWFCKEAANPSSNRQWRFLQLWLPKYCDTHSQSKHHPCTGILLLLGLLPTLQLSARLCSMMEEEFFQANFWLTVFASCHPHKQLPTYFKGKQQATYPVQPP